MNADEAEYNRRTAGCGYSRDEGGPKFVSSKGRRESTEKTTKVQDDQLGQAIS